MCPWKLKICRCLKFRKLTLHFRLYNDNYFFQMEETVFKVWSTDRTKKISLFVHCSVPNVIEKSNERLKIMGTRLVCEADGTEIEDDRVLKHFSGNTLIILEAHEFWIPKESFKMDTSNSSLKKSSTAE